MTSIGGEGIVFGLSNLIAGIIGQLYLGGWGKRKHGLTFTGKRTPKYYRLHPKKKVVVRGPARAALPALSVFKNVFERRIK
jgi:hypothetical protein